MKQETALSLLRTVLTLVGAFMVGGGLHKLFGQDIDAAYWEEIAGAIITIFSIGWSIATKQVDIEKLESGARQVATFVCSILVAKGVLNAQTSLAVIAFIGAIMPYVQGLIAKNKIEQIQSGKISAGQLVTKNSK